MERRSQAFCTNGKTFQFDAPLLSKLTVGCYVAFDANGSQYLGQILDVEVVSIERLSEMLNRGMTETSSVTSSPAQDLFQARILRGSGRLLKSIQSTGLFDPTPQSVFSGATITLATAAQVTQYLRVDGKSAELPVGAVQDVDGSPSISINCRGFDRHTFICGQSGSGKTFSLGVVLEGLLLSTSLRMIIIDPNSDFVRINAPLTRDEINRKRGKPLGEKEYSQLMERYQKVIPSIRILRPAGNATPSLNLLKVRFGELDQRTQAAVLRIDALENGDEFRALQLALSKLSAGYSLEDVRQELKGIEGTAARQVESRLANSGLGNWTIWSHRGESSVIDEIEAKPRCLVLDIGTLATGDEKAVVSLAVLNYLWSNRGRREPVLIVVDEAHNVCPQFPASSIESECTEFVVRFAAEGRKYGLYLLMGTQRPEKIHGNAVSQCDNLILMRLNSSSDLEVLAKLFSQVPRALLARSPEFRQGEALLVGKFVPTPTLIKFEGRLSEEGGTDIPTIWADRQR